MAKKFQTELRLQKKLLEGSQKEDFEDSHRVPEEIFGEIPEEIKKTQRQLHTELLGEILTDSLQDY